jgi:class 3 adenylate cyclase
LREHGGAAVRDVAPIPPASQVNRTITVQRLSGGIYITVLFCDLVGSTAIAAQLDPEE